MTHDVWHELLHGIAAAALIGGGAILLGRGWLVWRDPRVRRAAPEADPGRSRSTVETVLTVVAIALSLGAAAIHAAAAPAHLDELGALGWGFVVAAAFQTAWAFAYMVHPRRSIATVGALGNLVVLGAWAWSRTIGLPVGPLAGLPEAVGIADGSSVVLELLLVALLVFRPTAVGRRAARQLRRTPGLAIAAGIPVIGVIFLATTLAVGSALGHAEHGADPAHGGHPDGPSVSEGHPHS